MSRNGMATMETQMQPTVIAQPIQQSAVALHLMKCVALGSVYNVNTSANSQHHPHDSSASAEHQNHNRSANT
jgi:hypothetical protein